MEQLSGGEKTVAALPLLFSIHRYFYSETGTRRHLTTLEMENRLKRKRATAFTYGPVPSTSSARLCDVNRKPNSMDARCNHISPFVLIASDR
ncbi:hypothetical protein NC651_005111 [Populus alba x Populus x berolinensis]|nr:hypothetical protein NC651_005111 [Populus alba x Populus x berolinensis]